MSADMFFWASFEFSDEASAAAMRRELQEEGYTGKNGSPVDALTWSGTIATLRWDGSGPSDWFFEVGGLMSLLADGAEAGSALVFNLEAKFGERYHAGRSEADDSLDEATITRLYRAHQAG